MIGCVSLDFLSANLSFSSHTQEGKTYLIDDELPVRAVPSAARLRASDLDPLDDERDEFIARRKVVRTADRLVVDRAFTAVEENIPRDGLKREVSNVSGVLGDIVVEDGDGGGGHRGAAGGGGGGGRFLAAEGERPKESAPRARSGRLRDRGRLGGSRGLITHLERKKKRKESAMGRRSDGWQNAYRVGCEPRFVVAAECNGKSMSLNAVSA